MRGLAFDAQTGGGALIVGYCVLLLALFRDPTAGLETATATPQGTLFFLVFPLFGIASGVSLVVGYRFRTTVAFLGGSYLGVVGVALTLLPTANALLTTALGVFLMAVAVFALVGSLRSSAGTMVPDDFLGF